LIAHIYTWPTADAGLSVVKLAQRKKVTLLEGGSLGGWNTQENVYIVVSEVKMK
jgi:hypothetical protein